jgi:hypothetical protein
MKPEEAKFPNSKEVLSILTFLSILECTAGSQSFCSSVSHIFGIRLGTSAIKFERWIRGYEVWSLPHKYRVSSPEDIETCY